MLNKIFRIIKKSILVKAKSIIISQIKEVLMKILASLVTSLFLIIFVSSCTQLPTGVEETSTKISFQKVTVLENFEAGTKTAYAVGDVTFTSGIWTLNDALVGTTTSDPKNGTKSIRTRNSGKVTMKFNRTDGAGVVSVKHAKYGTDANSTWSLWYSTNSGSTWTQTGASVTTSSTTLQTASFTVNKTGTIRFEIRKTDGTTNRVNFDDFTINDYVAGSGNSETEPNNTTTAANPISIFPSTYSGYISTTSDIDYFSFSAASGQTITLGLTVPAKKNYNLYLLNASSATVASSTKASGLAESITYTATASGIYYVKISSSSGSSTTAAYFLSANVTGGGAVDTTTVHLTMGNPSGAVTNINLPANYLMKKAQYVLSYNRDKGTANWAAWHLNATWLGSTPRQDDFRADATLPAGWYQVQSTSFSGSGYDRGHMCPSADRTLTVTDNSSTFLMTNMIPQAPNNNQGPWANLETYCRTLVSQGKELYIYSGGYGSQGTIDAGRVNVPTRTWKIIVVLDEGTNDVSRVTTTTRIIAIDMPNSNSLIAMTDDWRNFRVSVDSLEPILGYDFLSSVSTSIQSVIESTVDNL